MARILFIVNEHPNEAFAISVARKTKELLEKAGHTVIWKKIDLRDTALGAVLKSPKRKRFSEEELDKINLTKTNARILSAIKKAMPAAAYTFHCTSDYERHWKSGKPSDFTIEPSGRWRKFKDLQLVEIKAKYRLLPQKVLNIVISKTQPTHPKMTRYLTTTTSQQVTRKARLHPENFAKAIAKSIEKQIKTGTPAITKGRVSRKAPKSWLQIIKRVRRRR